MIFRKLALEGAFAIDIEPQEDGRGYFARSFCVREFAEHGLVTTISQCSISFNPRRGTLRGLHWQEEPHGEEKLVRCSRGALYDVIVDLREGSPSRGRWAAVELSAANQSMLYIPRGFAHGYQTLADETEVVYQISTEFVPDAVRGLRWDDPAIAVEWPEAAERIISDRDRNLPLFAG